MHLIITVFPLYYLRDSIAEVFTVDTAVQQEISNIMIFNLLIYTLDSYLAVITAYMKGIAQETFATVSLIIT